MFLSMKDLVSDAWEMRSFRRPQKVLLGSKVVVAAAATAAAPPLQEEERG